jgi:hypothetical protein
MAKDQHNLMHLKMLVLAKEAKEQTKKEHL